jgi:pentatricopeptide repeat protein
MLRAGHAPNTTTYNALISAHSRAGNLDRVMEAFGEMVRSGCERRRAPGFWEWEFGGGRRAPGRAGSS